MRPSVEIHMTEHESKGIAFVRVLINGDEVDLSPSTLTEIRRTCATSTEVLNWIHQHVIGKTHGVPLADAYEEHRCVRPPRLFEWLLTLLLNKRRSEAVLGDLEELFNEDCDTRGERRARRLYQARVLNSIGPLLWRAIKKAGIVAAVADVARRYLGG